MEKTYCILCGSEKCRRQIIPGNQEIISCDRGYTFKVECDVFDLPKKTQQEIWCLIYERLLHEYDKKKYDRYFYSELETDKSDPLNRNYNLFELLKNFPKDITERSKRSLLNLNKMYPDVGSIIGVDILDSNAMFVTSEDYISETKGMFRNLIDFGYLNRIDNGNIYTISANGKLKIEELIKGIKTQNVFVALAFREETVQIREAIRRAIENSGYFPLLIDEKQHNNQIVPQILTEIKNSKFVVVDVSFSNNGAYYEAGYAHGQGKEVIVCCKKSVFDGTDTEPKPHFDISQKNFVLWKDTEDLVEKLVKRIDHSISKV